MSNTLWQATLDLAYCLQEMGALDLYEGAASGSGAAGKTTLVDTGMRITGTNSGTSTYPADDYFVGGVIWFRGPSSTPTYKEHNYGMYRQVTDFVNTTKTWTFAAVDDQTVASDLYTVAPKTIPLDVMQRMVNRAYQAIGVEDAYNEATTTAADTERYALPAGVYHVKRVLYRSTTATTDPWRELGHWYTQGGYLYFEGGYWPPVGLTLRIVYNGIPAELTLENDAITDEIDRRWLMWEACVLALQWLVGRTKDQTTAAFLNMASANAEKEAARFRPALTQRRRAMPVGPWTVPDGSNRADSEPNRVRL